MNTTPDKLSLAELRMPVDDVVEKYFGGDAEFFSDYQASCTDQFPIDLQDGQAACAASDAEALMRTAHNLKSILLTLGFTSISQEAATCEQCSQSGDVQLAHASWNRLAGLLTFVLESGALLPQQNLLS
jgi:HPt (histidine-containing phosphotransfer) domain-containing protein